MNILVVIDIANNDSFSREPFFILVINLIASSLAGYLLGIIYINYGKTISNRENLANIFPLLTTSTMIVITVVKSSLALSLGLVGALSIVRFRTPIKEPEELVFLFINIAIGLSIGANQYLFSIISLLTILLISFLRKKSRSVRSKFGSFSIFIRFPREIDKELIINNNIEKTKSTILKSYSQNNNDKSELVLNITIENYKSFSKLSDELNNISSDIEFDVIDTSQISGQN